MLIRHKISPAVPSEEHFTLQFNRKYDEEVVFLKDGSLVVVNVLFGVFLDGQLGSDSEHGCPSSANKYCNINEVNKLIPGLTVSVAQLGRPSIPDSKMRIDMLQGLHIIGHNIV